MSETVDKGQIEGSPGLLNVDGEFVDGFGSLLDTCQLPYDQINRQHLKLFSVINSKILRYTNLKNEKLPFLFMTTKLV